MQQFASQTTVSQLIYQIRNLISLQIVDFRKVKEKPNISFKFDSFALN